MNKLEEKFQKIKLLVLDFDGVMTDNRVLVSEDGKKGINNSHILFFKGS